MNIQVCVNPIDLSSKIYWIEVKVEATVHLSKIEAMEEAVKELKREIIRTKG